MVLNRAYKNLKKLILKLENISSKNKQKSVNIKEDKIIGEILFDLHELRRKIEIFQKDKI
ncbi:hypothetical protein [Aliarcobacter skirrowii]|uniref:Uncharacterized protein n=1 Tax=Aliarcobacter skirrowii CCUG 10374 TaxID=1032239 RepID=A0AAD0WN00_9BACT|nr:hypothetical protein [Aliarcobacter skirrowii]AXX84373.1 hypothetical protein ASKIR_0544 [Aliarcobacter skirrowii CCUG 10374]KAB0621451.1 hypothetical protein F7P70_00985 [Aliarcobacter skirrowii CCUG 10374]MDD3025723.1 hypothetical protein [Aliarcobacter skirrowii]RXI26708.1 hypothetical protein CP959_00990 [Aliarcobacter skirrowii CCUG 10374]SUV14532.1 Uncharacterised protein [Aliarcobacter skirrowii]